MGSMLARLTGRTTLAHVRHVRPVAPDAATGRVATVYRQVVDDFGMLAPPMALHSPAPAVLAAAWLMLRESLLANGLAARAEKEVVAAAVSLDNRCPYCVEVHGAAVSGLVGGAAPVAVHGLAGITEPRLRALGAWAQGTGPPPFPAAQAPEFEAVAMTFDYLNRMVNVFLRESPLPTAPPAVRRGLRIGAARLMGRLARPGRPPGVALELLPAAPLPPDLAWAMDRPILAQALSRAAAAIDAAGAAVTPEPVRRLLLAQLSVPPGQRDGLGTAWLDAAVAQLPAGQGPAGRLALLTAFASYRVTAAVVADFRAVAGDDEALVALTAWASLTTARHVAGRRRA
jgi:AhpD family alkylhydroperoxidase